MVLRWRNICGHNSVYFFSKSSSDGSAGGALREIGVEEYLLLPVDLMPWPANSGLRQRFMGNRLLALQDGGEIRCFGWVTRARSMVIGELAGATASFAAPVDWIWDCVTPRHLRGRGHYPRMLKLMMQRLDEPVVYCSVHNQSSVKGITKSGFALAAQVTSYPWGIRSRQLGPAPLGLRVSRSTI